jgi:hypothetical protein
MKTRIRAIAVLGLPAVVACCSLPSPTVAATSTVAPLPPSNYTVRSVCAAPAPGYASCLALRLVAKAPLSVPGARALVRPGSGTTGRAAAPSIIEFKKPIAGSLTPAELLGAYSLNGASPPAGTQTIALVDAYDDPKAESDLATYDKEFKLPECIEASGCFRKVNQEGNKSPLPPSNTEGREPEAGWALETSTDIEVAHAVCQSCHILLVEADSSELLHLETAEETAVKLLNATEVSNSWGTPECEVGACIGEGSAFHDPGVVITAAAGDNGYLDWAAEELKERGFADYPASLPDVVAVGGTRLLQSHGVWEGETVWNDGGQNTKGEIEGAGAGGGGCSTSFLAKPWQQSASEWLSVGCGEHRAVADVSADADPYTGVAVYDSTPVTEEGEEIKGWNVLGGTSVASPIIASVFALAGGSHGVGYPAQTLYENLAASPNSLHDVVTGSNGACLKPFEPNNGLSGCTPAEEAANSKCSAKLICLAGPGYDGPTGVGTPNGIVAFQPLTEEAKKKLEERKAKEKQVEEQKRKEKIEEEARSKSTGASTTGASPPTAVTPPGALASPGTTTSSSPGPAVQPTIRLSAFALTPNALIALRRVRPRTSSVGFVFTLSAAARVRVTLAKQLNAHGRRRWQTLPYSLTIAGAPGRDRGRLNAHGTLTPGRYRLTLAPAHGVARSLTFEID